MKHSKRRKRKHRDSPEHESRNTGDVPPAAASAAVAADNPGQKKRKISPIQVTPPPPKGGRKLSRLQEKMTKQLEGAQFRFLNEQLYTSSSKDAVQLFKEDPKSFQIYHSGFRNQAESWPLNPIDVFIKLLSKRKGAVIGDFGCGEAKLAEQLEGSAKKVYSFDLVALNPRVTPCDISDVPLGDRTLDVAVFSLSLMGTNWMDFVQEAHRTLKPHGKMYIAEVRSRFGIDESGTDAAQIKEFISVVTSIGFQFKRQILKNKMFVIMEFTKRRPALAGAEPTGRKKKRKKGRKKGGEAKAEQQDDENGTTSAAAESLEPGEGEGNVKKKQFVFKPCLYKRR